MVGVREVVDGVLVTDFHFHIALALIAQICVELIEEVLFVAPTRVPAS
jgi:hypothetical protein